MMRVETLQVGRRLDAQPGFVLHLGRMRVYSSPRVSLCKKAKLGNGVNNKNCMNGLIERFSA